MATLEKGVTELRYETKEGTVLKYRVRIKKKDFSFNKLFDTLELANEAVKLSSSTAGKRILKETLLGIDEKEKKVQEYANILGSEALRILLNIYYENELKKEVVEEKDENNNESNEYKIKALLETKIPDTRSEDPNNPLHVFLKNASPIMRASFKPTNVKLGDMSVFEIQERHISDYVNARLSAGRKESTIKRELTVLSGFFTRIALFGDKYKIIKNPVRAFNAISRKLHGTFIKRDRRLEDGEAERLYQTIAKMRNPDMMKILKLAHYTGMRRSEILGLKWGQLKNCYQKENNGRSYIFILKGKNQEPRKVKVFSEAQEVIDSLIKPKTAKDEDRVFSYTTSGFNTNIRRAIKKAKLEDYRFHDLRAELITQLFEAGFPSQVVATAVNIDNQTYFDRTHKKNFEERKMLESEILDDRQIRLTAGHKDKNVQRRYTRSLLDKVELPKK